AEDLQTVTTPDGSKIVYRSDDDDTEMVLRTDTDAWTYLAADIAYHQDKITRGFDRIVDVLRPDHRVYMDKLRAGVSAVGGDDIRFAIRLVAPLQTDAELSARELVARHGVDALRFWLLCTDPGGTDPRSAYEALQAAVAFCQVAPTDTDADATPEIAAQLLRWPILRRIAIATHAPELIADYAAALSAAVNAAREPNGAQSWATVEIDLLSRVLDELSGVLGIDVPRRAAR
ncbi:MAG: hypothetical protein QNJ09_04605, partial [Paracoccaceae bacterium]|nr:hypothetical protein [Paracoccaceae bacterium]